jgi:5-methylcytosine-specific restriction endonuclease McrA
MRTITPQARDLIAALDMQLSGLHKHGPTIDHIIPLMLSKDDRRNNVQLAHRTCNIRKSALDNLTARNLMKPTK